VSMSESTNLSEWLKLTDTEKKNLFTATGNKVGLPAVAVEKDWWVVQTLSLISSMECAESILFKGGTSLSKGWNLIKRFSEDIDLALDRSFLGFTGQLKKSEIRRLRKASFDYITNIFLRELEEKFNEAGFDHVSVNDVKVANHDQDPTIIEIYYPKLTEKDSYMRPGLLVEIGFRSLGEPNTKRSFRSMVAENFSSAAFADKPLSISTVNPERTFLEKIFLLHEEHQKPGDKIRIQRMSRHLYDIQMICKTEFADRAFENPELYKNIVNHRQRFTRISGIDYSKHSPASIRFIPPENLLRVWESDYIRMKENMIYGESSSLDGLIQELSDLQSKINRLDWQLELEER